MDTPSLLPDTASGPSRPVPNTFNTPATARRYSSSRPRTHDHVLQVMAKTLQSHLPVARALDVGCGTGNSSIALLPYAQSIVGIDASSEMLAVATRHPAIRYYKGYAEALPVRSKEYELVTVGSAYHWFDHNLFLAEAARVLRPGGWLVLYKASSTGRAINSPAFDNWRREVLRARYPKVVRNGEHLTPERAAHFNFTEVRLETVFHEESYSLAEYVENLLTHSSIARVVDGGQEPVAVARAWLKEELAPFFPGGYADFLHESRIHVLQRT